MVLPDIQCDYGYLTVGGRSLRDMPFLDQRLCNTVYGEGTERRKRCCDFRIVDLGAGPRAADHSERRGTRHSRSCFMLSETKSLLMDDQNRLCARFHRLAHTSQMEPLNAPCNRCGEWRAYTSNTSVKRLDQFSSELTMVGMGAASRQKYHQAFCTSTCARSPSKSVGLASNSPLYAKRFLSNRSEVS